MIAWERSRAASGRGIIWGGTQIKTNKEELPHGVFVFGHPSRYESCKTGLNFVEQMTCGAVLVNVKMRGMKMRIITCFGDQTISRG